MSCRYCGNDNDRCLSSDEAAGCPGPGMAAVAEQRPVRTQIPWLVMGNVAPLYEEIDALRAQVAADLLENTDLRSRVEHLEREVNRLKNVIVAMDALESSRRARIQQLQGTIKRIHERLGESP